MKLFPLVFVAAVLSPPAIAAPADDTIVETGKAAGSYNRAKSLCREAGFAMPEVQEVNEPLLSMFLKFMAQNRDLFFYGYEKGQEEASNSLRKPGANIAGICENYRSVITPKK